MSENNKDIMVSTLDVKGRKHKINLNKYKEYFSDKDFFEKIRRFAKNAGIKVIYASLLLYYAFKKSTTPKWAKGVIAGALGYFILPVDVIPDVVPVVGFADDLGLILVALGAVAFYIDEDIKDQAKTKLKDWFGEYDENHLDYVDSKITNK